MNKPFLQLLMNVILSALTCKKKANIRKDKNDSRRVVWGKNFTPAVYEDVKFFSHDRTRLLDNENGNVFGRLLFNRKQNKSFILLFLCLATGSVYAKNGIFFTGEGGIATQINLPSVESIGALKNTASQPSAWRLGIGYNHDLYSCLGIGVEVGYGWYGKNTYDFGNYSKKIQSSTSEYLVLMQWHLTQWDLIGKLGGIRHKITITKPVQDSDQTKINLMAGATLAYNLTAHWAVLGSYNHVFGQQNKNFDILTGSTVALNEYLLGVRYSF